MYVVFDTNILLQQLVLNSKSGAAVRFYMRQHNATVVVPEVVQLELERALKERLTKDVDDIRSRHADLLAVFGKLPEVVLPSEADIASKVAEVILCLDIPWSIAPLSLAVSRSSLQKIIDRQPPSKTKEEFRDGVIWAHCVELLATDDVYLVTADNDFYESGGHGRVLARNLQEESQANGHYIRIVSGLGELLDDIREDIDLDQQRLVAAYLRENGEHADRLLTRVGYVRVPAPRVDAKVFATEASDRLYAEYTIVFACTDVSEQGRGAGELLIRGSGTYNAVTGEWSDLRRGGERLVWPDIDGDQQLENYVLQAEGIVLGHRSIQHTARYLLE